MLHDCAFVHCLSLPRVCSPPRAEVKWSKTKKLNTESLNTLAAHWTHAWLPYRLALSFDLDKLYTPTFLMLCFLLQFLCLTVCVYNGSTVVVQFLGGWGGAVIWETSAGGPGGASSLGGKDMGRGGGGGKDSTSVTPLRC